MKRITITCILFLLFVSIGFSHAAGSPDRQNQQLEPLEIRHEFENLFGRIKIYQVIRKYLPESYEEMYRSYATAKRSNKMEEFKASSFINSIRNAHLKQSSDQSILEFYRHIIVTGREIFRRDPEAAFSYIFGGSPSDYSQYVDFQGELESLGEIFDHLLSSCKSENLQAIDKDEADNGLTLVFINLHYKYGEKLSILQSKDYSLLSKDEKNHLCDIYLYMHEQIFNLEPPTRNYVLRSFAMNL